MAQNLCEFDVQKLVEPTTINYWAVVNFSARCDIDCLIKDLIRCGNLKGMVSTVL